MIRLLKAFKHYEEVEILFLINISRQLFLEISYYII